MRPVVLAVSAATVFGGAWLSHTAQDRVDDTRRQTASEHKLLVMPSPDTIRLASQGLHVHVATIMWVRSVIVFGERMKKVEDRSWQEWFLRMLQCTVELDPTWRTPYFYGGAMVRVNGDVAGSTEVFKAATEALPHDPYFPFSVAMNYYLEDKDYEQAAIWMERAAEVPNAPGWYRVSAIAMRQHESGAEGAMRFLEAELEQTEDPVLRQRIEERMHRLQHEEYALRLNEVAERFEGELTDPQQLVDADLLRQLPNDPDGSEWVVSPVDGMIMTRLDYEKTVGSALKAERRYFRWHKNQ